jgi:hypothetical protein
MATSVTHCWHDHPRFTFFAGEHDGYRHLADPVRHRRTVLFVRGRYWIVTDELLADGTHDYALWWHFAPSVRAEVTAGGTAITAVAGDAALDLNHVGPDLHLTVTDGFVSPCYGAEVSAPVGCATAHVTGVARFVTLLVPRRGNDARPVIQSIEPDTVSIASPGYNELFVTPVLGSRSEGLVDTDFQWLWLRRGTDGSLREAVAIHGRRFGTPEVALALTEPLSVAVLARNGNELRLELSPPVDGTVEFSGTMTRIVVNGQSFDLRRGAAFSWRREQVSPVQRDVLTTGRCEHVRH